MKSIQVFNNIEHNNQFLREGFVTIPLLNTDEADQLKAGFHSIHPEMGNGFYASLFNPDSDKKQQSDMIIRKILEEKILAVLSGFRFIISNYVVKYPGKDSIMYPHQDWCFVDEELYHSINVWIPLTTNDFKNGSLHLLRNSHQLPNTFRGTNIPSAVAEVASKINLSDLYEVPVPIGEAVFYDHRMIHASPPNLGKEIRIAAAMVVIPQQAELIHYVKIKDQLYQYKIENDFFYKFTYNNDPDQPFSYDYPMISAIPYVETSFGLKQLMIKKGILSRLFGKKSAS
jgi:hypothetical protein